MPHSSERRLPRLASLGALLLCGAAGANADTGNRYGAPFTANAPVIDGVMDSTWDKAPWDSIPYTYIGTTPSKADFAGRYKALWDAGHVYLLVEVVDDSVSDTHADPLDNYWNDDALELFVDENRNGGDHQNNFSAWAYHIGTRPGSDGAYDVVDNGTDQKAHLFNSHFTVKRTQTGHTSIWELGMLVYGESYTLAGPNAPLSLAAGKSMGFTVAYCDNDGGTSRENFFGSVNTPGHFQNQGYINASCFGILELLAPSTSGARPRSVTPALKPQSFLRRGETSWSALFRRADGPASSILGAKSSR